MSKTKTSPSVMAERLTEILNKMSSSDKSGAETFHSTIDKILRERFTAWLTLFTEVVKTSLSLPNDPDLEHDLRNRRNIASEAFSDRYTALVDNRTLTNADACLAAFVRDLMEAHNEFLHTVPGAMLSDHFDIKPVIVPGKKPGDPITIRVQIQGVDWKKGR